jgi:adenosylcobinamide-phosphate synthase
MNSVPHEYILPAAFILDLIIGDPDFLPHPIRYMGSAIAYLEPRFRKLPAGQAAAGCFFALFLIFFTWCIGFLIVAAGRAIHPIFGFLIETILLYYCLSVKSLKDAAMSVYNALRHPDLEKAKQRVGLIVGRDVNPLDKEGITRATVETVAENLVDGVLSPLFFAALGGAPLALAYKMINTLDSMVGYKNDTYIHFGKTSAKIDDFFNFIPARIAVPIIAISAQLFSGKGVQAFRTAIQDGRCHTSPNAGYPEAAFSGALEVTLGGPNVYHGKLVAKPSIGKHFGKTNAEHIKKACSLMIVSSLMGLLLFWFIRALIF